MTVLGTISKRLKTDIGETARAAVDPTFAKAQMTAEFEQKRHERDRSEELADLATERKSALADEARKQKTRTEMFVMSKAVDDGLSSGNWESVSKLNESLFNAL